MLSLVALLGCAPTEAPPSDTTDPVTLADPRDRAGCTYAARLESGTAGTHDCRGTYDDAANDLGETCLYADGRTAFWLSQWDAEGCNSGAHWYIEYEDGGDYEWTATMTCDEHQNETGGEDRQVERADGEVVMDIARTWTVANEYDGGLLSAAQSETSDGYVSSQTWTYDGNGWVTVHTVTTEASEMVTTYARDANGNVLHRESELNGRVYATADFTYDALGREQTARYDETRAVTTTYEADTTRFVERLVDEGQDGTIDAVDTYTWDCP